MASIKFDGASPLLIHICGFLLYNTLFKQSAIHLSKYVDLFEWFGYGKYLSMECKMGAAPSNLMRCHPIIVYPIHKFKKLPVWGGWVMVAFILVFVLFESIKSLSIISHFCMLISPKCICTMTVPLWKLRWKILTQQRERQMSTTTRRPNLTDQRLQ